jgi:hypothetical protein
MNSHSARRPIETLSNAELLMIMHLAGRKNVAVDRKFIDGVTNEACKRKIHHYQ